VGALARHAEVLASAEAAQAQPLLAMALSHVAHPTIRNRGTTVGSIVHADAAAEMPMVLRLLEGSVDVASVRGRRTIPAAELFAGPLESTLAHDEVAVEAFFPSLAPGAGVAFQEIARRHGDYALVGVAALVETDGGEVTRARVGFVSVSDVPVVVDVTDALDDPAAKALAELDPAEDIHATAAYRAHLVKVLAPRVLAAATDHARSRAGEAIHP
jgi:2-furoyl-CoA dehydrogenase FAD binding subunit